MFSGSFHLLWQLVWEMVDVPLGCVCCILASDLDCREVSCRIAGDGLTSGTFRTPLEPNPAWCDVSVLVSIWIC